MNVPNIYWLVADDTDQPNQALLDYLAWTSLPHTYLTSKATTLTYPYNTDPIFLFPKGRRKYNFNYALSEQKPALHNADTFINTTFLFPLKSIQY